ncbi:hypothetical protein [Sphingobacterium sp. BIGb0165]|uniref:hypothetical protein n=1 Tax=Sphingobacterium sp. BIGb0165 TaxID=2940615 RepID=UPI0021674DC8|nr:hypothetical protein [Sphingobacterium sp. BIGb0165]MCS4227420.1 hypothetical protein [Sphingobacterium sp. BIGb0165]
MKYLFILLLFAITAFDSFAEQLYVNPVVGNDLNSEEKSQPLKTIFEAAKRINSNQEKGTSIVILSSGMHLLTETVIFSNNKYTGKDRLIIRAEIMPDDKDWTPQQMPVIVTAVPLVPGFGGMEGRGIQPEVSHVTIEGIRFTGSPDYSYMDEDNSRRSYPIWRDGKRLDDLLVTQCLFVGNIDVLPLHAGVIANGYGLVIDHCVFFNCKNPVVFWKSEGPTGGANAMRYCLVYGSYFSGVWTTNGTNGDNFEFHHNIIANSSTVWVREKGSTKQYKAFDCVFSDYTHLAGYGSGPLRSDNPTSSDFLKMERVIHSGDIQIEKDQSKANYLQLKAGSDGSDLGAGLSKRNK